MSASTLSANAQTLLEDLKQPFEKHSWTSRHTFEEFKLASSELLAAKLVRFSKYGYLMPAK